MHNGSNMADGREWALDKRPTPLVTDDMLDIDVDRPIPSARGVLTKHEIEALLRPNLPDDIGATPEPERIVPRLPLQFDETRFSPAEAAARKSAGILAARLSLALGQSTGVKAAIGLRDVASVETSDLAAMMMGRAGAVACFGATETDAQALVCLPGAFADALITQTCGGRGQSGRIGDGWVLSAIDCALLMELLKPIAATLGDGLRLQTIETDVPYVTSLLPAGTVNVAEYSVEAPGLQSELAVISVQDTGPEPRSEQAKLPMTAVVTARIASLNVSLSRLTSLKAGATLLLGVPGDQPVEILSGDRNGPVAFEGQMGRKGNKVAVKITRKLRGVLER